MLIWMNLLSFVFAREARDVTVAVQGAKDSGVPEEMLTRLLALGYKYDLRPDQVAGFVNVMSEAKAQNLPVGPLVSKIEEGLAKL